MFIEKVSGKKCGKIIVFCDILDTLIMSVTYMALIFVILSCMVRMQEETITNIPI